MNIDRILTELEKPVQVKDILGQILNTGDTILYSPQTVTNNGLREGKILKINYETNELSVDTCRVCVAPKNVVRIDDLLAAKGITETKSSLPKNTSNVYLFYCISYNDNTDKLLLFKPEHTGNTGLYMEFLNLCKKYPYYDFIPILNTYHTHLDFYIDKTLNENNVNLKRLQLNESMCYLVFLIRETGIKKLNISLDVLYGFKQNTFDKNSKDLPLNTLLDFDFIENETLDGKKELELNIELPNKLTKTFNHSFLNSKFNVQKLYDALLTYWQIYLPDKMERYKQLKILCEQPKNIYGSAEFLNFFSPFEKILSDCTFFQRFLCKN